MTILELHQRLKENGYRNAVASGFSALAKAGDEYYENELRKALEIDRREVFRRWYGPGKWMKPFREAHDEMVSMVRDNAVSYILQNP